MLFFALSLGLWLILNLNILRISLILCMPPINQGLLPIIKPIHISLSEFGESLSSSYYNSCSTQNNKPKHENGFVKTKSKALKIYGDLTKMM